MLFSFLSFDSNMAEQTCAGITVFVWSHPRALSTALLRSLAELPHTTTVLEPFMIPWQAKIGFLNREKNPNPPSFENIIDNIEVGDYFTQADQHVQVIKEMPVHVPPDVFDAIFERFPNAYHIFLVRHPYHMIPSYFKAILKDPQAADFTQDVIRMDTTYRPLLDAAQRISTSGSASVLMLDAESLHADPRSSLTRLCNHIGVPFVESVLQWTPNHYPSSWRDLHAFEGWLDTVVSSSGWEKRPLDADPVYPEVSVDFQRECIDANMPIYEQLMHMFVQS